MSEEPWASLNVGGGIGDDPANVAENRRRVLSALGRSQDSTYDVWQIHSAQILHADEPRLGPPYPKADGLITANPDVTLMLRFADCVPVMLLDPSTPAIGLIHAGWKGTILGTVMEGIRAMKHQFGSPPEDILAAIGPAIAGHH
ncbi:MAG: polyphenol oxidase family protein, partial [Anaerolineales bacterium]|nr:polyphenol oxidase family protein [Anaerolineales bacterium]